jgi:hydrogenase-4 component B
VSTGVLVLLLVSVCCWALGPVLVVLLPRSRVRLALVAASGVAGGLACGAAGVITVAASRRPVTLSLGSWQGLGNADLRIDALSGFFLAVTGAVAALLFAARAAALPHLRGRLHITALAAMLVALVTLLVADNAFFFLAGYEGLAVAFYVLVASGYRRHFRAADAAAWAMGMTKLGGALVLIAFLALSAGTGSLAFSAFRSGGGALAAGLADTVLVCAVVGFGVKVAMLPLQSWLPRAYPAAPTGAPAFLAAVALNAGFYGLIRVASFLGPGPLWWGLVVLLAGALTALVGILYSAVQTDLKALVAYSSIENAGIILTGIGAWLVGRAAGLPLLAGLGLVAALFQIAVHSVAKAALFACADAVERHAGTTDMGRLGGLVRRLPAVTVIFAVAAATIIGLPPLGGFASEWLTLETLMQGFRIPSLAAGVSFAIAGALLALTAAVAGIAFVKALFATFLGLPRSQRPATSVGPAMAAAGAGLAVLGIALGVGSPWVVTGLGRAAAATGQPDVGTHVSTGDLLIEPAFAHFSSIAPTRLAVVVPAFALALVLIGCLVRNRRLPVVRTPVWTSGAAAPGPRVQYTPTGWSNPTRVVFDTVLRTRRHRTVAGPRLAPREVRYQSEVPNSVDDLLIVPLVGLVMGVARGVQRLQSGSVAHYILYILAVLIVILVLVPVGR